MTLEDLGYNSEFENYRNDENLDSFGVGRVISEHKKRHVLKIPEKEYEGEIVGNLRFTAHIWADFPAVGNWVAKYLIILFSQEKHLLKDKPWENKEKSRS